MFRFASYYFLLFIPIVIYLFFMKRKNSSIEFSSIATIKKYSAHKTIKHKIGEWLILLGIILLLVALSRPQLVEQNKNIYKKGIDIALALDVSGSMESVDFKPSRIEVAKDVLKKFVDKRENDRISFVIFSGTAYTKIPLTIDYNVLDEAIAKTTTKDVNTDGTAIGMGIAVAVNRLKNSKAKSKVIILLTDGDNNAGLISPEAAMKLAKDTGIKIYTIGVGTNKTIMPVKDGYGNIVTYRQFTGGLDEGLLKKIANATEGKYFRAKDKNSLENIFKTINSLEKTKIKSKKTFQYKELYYLWLLFGLLFMILGIILEKLIYIKIP
ncbi:VWA domain-containing protein [Haliovirga abyssi]|uniref:BatA protein n=1 Tax=Haliovirga abyssi TaxID=2996794 RepID=A0AAU9DY45_9FUSO|nr:VWA domain-containing protein [Haliovirga abyssi]BDU50330.1 BatA protein [Haliovirga abyssi]